MDNRFYSRQSVRNFAPPVITTESRSGWWWPTLGCLAVLGMLGGAMALDDADRIKDEIAAGRRQAELRNQWEQGRQVGHQEAALLQDSGKLQQLRDTYSAGITEGRERCPRGVR